MVTFYMYCGISGSGKTYKAYEMHGKDTIIIDSDNVREQICPNGAVDQTMNAKVFEFMYKETCKYLTDDISICYVATNISAKRRISLLKNLRKKFKDLKCICYIINTPINTCYERNTTRERHVPDYVIKRQLESFQIPCEEEGWNKIEIIDNYKEDYDAINCMIDIQEQVKNFGNQNNIHHNYTLEKHCLMCGNEAIKKKSNKFIIQAGYIHDYGKILTATRWDKDNYKEVHYPGHASVSGYLALNMGYSLHVAQLVAYHMLPYTDQKCQDTWRARLGENLWKEIIELHRYDEAAH